MVFILKMNIEKMIMALVIVPLALTSINTLIIQGNSLTREEAIEIGKNSQLVQSLFKNAEFYTLEVNYENQTDVWHITWYIHPMGAVSAFRYVVGQSIDGETGEILDEGATSAR